MKTPINLDQLLKNPLSLSEKFHQKTKLRRLKGFSPSTLWPESWKKIYFKSYARLEEIILPKPSLDERTGLKNALIQRKSDREFSGKELSRKTISTLLYYCSGIKKTTQNNK